MQGHPPPHLILTGSTSGLRRSGQPEVTFGASKFALTGIAARNGIMMVSHYLHLLREEGESFDQKMILRGTQERIIPVLMTALTAGFALIPLLLGAGQPGREILHPVAVVIFFGLFSSTLLDLTVRPLVFWKFGRSAAIKNTRHIKS